MRAQLSLQKLSASTFRQLKAARLSAGSLTARCRSLLQPFWERKKSVITRQNRSSKLLMSTGGESNGRSVFENTQYEHYGYLCANCCTHPAPAVETRAKADILYALERSFISACLPSFIFISLLSF